MRPSRTSPRSPASSSSSIRAGVGAGSRARTSACAASTSTPVGAPSAPRRIRPPGGSGVSRPIPASASASAFTQQACPSTRSSTAGRSGTARVSVAAVGNRDPGQRFWSQPRPRTQASPGAARAPSAARAAHSSSLAAPAQLTSRRARPSHCTWPWASTSPGTTLPPRSRSAPAPASAAHSASVPTRAIRPPRTSTAPASGRAGSSVWIRPTTRRSCMAPHRAAHPASRGSRPAGARRSLAPRPPAFSAGYVLGRSASCVGRGASAARPVSTASRIASKRSWRARTAAASRPRADSMSE